MSNLTNFRVPIYEAMPYISGETPMVGDRVQDRVGQVGIVKSVQLYRGNYELTIKWDGSNVGIRYSDSERFTLVLRRA